VIIYAFDICVCCAVETDEQLSKTEHPDSSGRKEVIGGSCSKTVSMNSISSEKGASDAAGLNARELPQHTSCQLDQFSSKSCSTTSQLSNVADRYETSVNYIINEHTTNS